MKAETQANALASLVREKKQYPQYELVLPFFEVKRSVIKKLSVGDVLLLGMQSLDLSLLSEKKFAKVDSIIEEGKEKIQILYLEEETLKQLDTKKYETLKCSFGMLQSRRFDVGYKVDISALNLENITLFVEDKNIASGILVKVDNEIAIEINKVKNDEK